MDARLVVLGTATSGMDGGALLVQEDGAVIGPWLDGLGTRIAIVRPDNYVYGTASGINDAIALVDRLGRQLACIA